MRYSSGENTRSQVLGLLRITILGIYSPKKRTIIVATSDTKSDSSKALSVKLKYGSSNSFILIEKTTSTILLPTSIVVMYLSGCL